MTNGKFKPYHGKRAPSHERLNQLRVQNLERELLDCQIVGSILYEAAKMVVDNATEQERKGDKINRYTVYRADFEAIAAAVRLVERKLKKVEKIG